MSIRIVVMSIISSVLVSACSVVGIRSGTEEPRYSVVATLGVVEIREYAPRLAAEVTVSGSETGARGDGFRQLARFIFGGNSAQSSIAMTAPVAQAEAAPGVWRVRFFMPATYREATLPRPVDPGVTIVALPAATYAVYRYSGSTGSAATAAADRALLEGLRGSGWTASGVPVAWFYDPPWTLPFLRRNETAVSVIRAEGAPPRF